MKQKSLFILAIYNTHRHPSNFRVHDPLFLVEEELEGIETKGEELGREIRVIRVVELEIFIFYFRIKSRERVI